MHLTCEYNEDENGKNIEYKHFTIHDNENNEIVFSTGSPVDDYRNAVNYAALHDKGSLTCSSSVFDFVYDHPDYSWCSDEYNRNLLIRTDDLAEYTQKYNQKREDNLNALSKAFQQGFCMDEALSKAIIKMIYDSCGPWLVESIKQR